MEKLKEYAIGSSDLTYDLIERILNDGTHLVLSDEAMESQPASARCATYRYRPTSSDSCSAIW